mmetsp:Transcript_106834/g.297418  ORF Transcript_106834/g.297418 Transcript_106834/m.297418 type:complete len:219 (+) Transcript_106834:911-1567(+)
MPRDDALQGLRQEGPQSSVLARELACQHVGCLPGLCDRLHRCWRGCSHEHVCGCLLERGGLRGRAILGKLGLQQGHQEGREARPHCRGVRTGCCQERLGKLAACRRRCELRPVAHELSVAASDGDSLLLVLALGNKTGLSKGHRRLGKAQHGVQHRALELHKVRWNRHGRNASVRAGIRRNGDHAFGQDTSPEGVIAGPLPQDRGCQRGVSDATAHGG